MNLLIKTGRKSTILISISIVLISLQTIYFYHNTLETIIVKKLIQQLTRLVLTIGLLILVYKGKEWAKNLAVVLFSIGSVFSIIALFMEDVNLINKIPLIVIVFIYSLAIYHFGFSKSFKAFFKYQNEQ
jgi:presenilin-like A22 family membrane protease